MAKTTMLISLDQEIKERFQAQAKKMWTNASNLVSMVIVQFLENKNKAKYLDLEIENFSEEEIKSMWKDFLEKTEVLTEKARNILKNKFLEWKL